MATSVSTVEALIVKATDVLNKENDPNAMQRICQAITTEQGGVETAVRLIAHKIQSPQEWEALQALLILQSCVNNCGPDFHAEIGKYRFLNEMIKIISPKFLGLQRPAKVKEKVTQLLYTWTIDLPKETKISDAYQMLKKQDIVQRDPQYLGLKAPIKTKSKSSFKNEEKTRHLQKLLQSKNPLDISRANTIIKLMVKEDEWRTETTARRSIEVETAMTNVNVLDDMISLYEKNPTDTADLDLMSELNSSCGTLQASIYRLVSEIDEEDEGIGKLLKANDELSRVIGRYKSIVVGKNKLNDTLSEITHDPAPSISKEDTLLDFSSQASKDVPQPPSESLRDLNLLETAATPAIPAVEEIVNSTIVDDILSLNFNPPSLNKLDKVSPTFQALSSVLVPDKPAEAIPPKTEEKQVDPFDDLDLIGSTLLHQNLPNNTSSSRNKFKPQEKLSINQLIDQKHNPFIKDVSLLIPNKSRSSSSSDCSGVLSNASSLIAPISSKGQLSSSNSSLSSTETNVVAEGIPKGHKPNTESVSPKAQFASVLSMHDLHVALEDICPSSRAPIKMIESNEITMSVHFTENHPREDVSALVVSVTSQNKLPISNYVLQAVVPKGCKTRLLVPSSTHMAAYSPFLPPPAITQVILIANPNKINIFLKMMLSYTIDDDLYTDMGEVDGLPL